TNEPTAPKSAHVSDPTLKPFLQSTFDPADYLNATLPSLALSSVSSRPLKQSNAVPLSELSSQTQDLVSQLNAHTTRLSAILTQLTDDILRSGGRLAYEVELLRGETIGLTETLSDGLKDDISKFLPGGLSTAPPANQSNEEPTRPSTEPSTTQNPASKPTTTSTPTPTPTTTTNPSDPTSPLRTLTLIRTRLDSVIKIFGEAMHWTLPPSDLSTSSLASSLISVSSPSNNPSSSTTTADSVADREKRGKEFALALRTEIADLIMGSEDAAKGAEAAAVRIQALRELAGVWKGTAEEKARIKFVESLVKLAEEKQREYVQMHVQQQQQQQQQRPRPGRSGSGSVKREVPAVQAQQQQQQQQKSSGGFLDNLQRIR
ncbi:uncharacterized protein EI97DRAFT_361611, partial [Westerdykella ornata]